MTQIKLFLDFLAFGNHHATRNANYGTVGRHLFDDDRIRADLATRTHGKRPQHLCAGTDNDIIPQSGMAFFLRPGRPTKGHAVIKGAVFADFGGFADHNSHAVIDKKTLADTGSRMNLDAGQKAADMRNKAAEEIELSRPQCMSQPIKQQGMKPRVTEEDLGHAAHGRVSIVNRFDILLEGVEHRL